MSNSIIFHENIINWRNLKLYGIEKKKLNSS